MLTAYNISFGQIFNPDPYKIDFTNLNFECTRQETVKNKIKKISSKEYEIKKDGTKNEKSKTDFYFVEFNKAGNPIHYRYKSYTPTHNPKDEISETYDYTFEYDSLDNLIHIQEYEVHFLSPETHDENDVYFSYDKKNNLISQTVSKKYIYAPGFKYRGTTYRNDTTITKYFFNYDNSQKVTVVYKYGYESFRDTKSSDTLKFYCTFDSVFIEKDIPKGMKVDSLGRVIENTWYSIHALLLGGACISPDSPNDIITNFFYDSDGKLIKSESHSRKGDFAGRHLWTYNENGLLQSKHAENSKQMTIYEYEFY